MRKLLSVILVLFTLSTIAQQGSSYKLTIGKPTPSFAKNFQNISGESLVPQDYGAFGSVVDLTDSVGEIMRWAKGHLSGGKYYTRNTSKTSHSSTSWKLFYEWDHNLEDVYAHRVGDSIIVMFSSSDNNLNGGTWATLKCAYFICDLHWNKLAGPIDVIGGSGISTGFQRNWPFGRGGSLGVPGAYGQAFVSYSLHPPDWNYVDSGKLWFARTFDSWQTFQLFPFYSGEYIDETLLIPFPDGRAIMIRRQAGPHNMWRCTNTLADTPTWEFVGAIDLTYFNYGTTIPTYDIHGGYVDIVHADRNTDNINASLNNPFDSLWIGKFNPSIVVAYASVDSSGSTYTPLGYPGYLFNAGRTPSGDTLSFLNASREVHWSAGNDTTGKAQLWGTFVDWKHDETGALPVQPPSLGLVSGTLAPNSFKLQISGYTEAQIQNIKYWLWDISTSPTFSTFSTLEVEWGHVTADHNTAHVAIPCRNLRIPAQYVWPQNLPSGTTYYVRVKAVNNAGESAYTSTSITTL